MTNTLHKVAIALADAVWPPVCSVCEGRVDLSGQLCSQCISQLRPLEGTRCHRCSSDAHIDTDSCPECRTLPPYVDARVIVCEYRAVRPWIIAHKYRWRQNITPLLGQILAEGVAGNQFAVETDVVIPVPLSALRQQDRGFNQSEQLASAVATHLGKPLAVDGLRRTRNTQPQARLGSPEQRAANVAGAFEVDNLAVVAGKRVLLIDDVITTGATVSECARALREAGASSVVVAALAHPFRTPSDREDLPLDI